MALPPEPLDELLDQAYRVVVADVVSEEERGPDVPVPARPDGWVGPSEPLPWQVLRIHVREVLFGPDRPREPMVLKPAAPYELDPGSVSAVFLLGRPTSDSRDLPVILGRYGPSYGLDIVCRAVSARP